MGMFEVWKEQEVKTELQLAWCQCGWDGKLEE